MRKLKRKVTNKSRVEGSIANAYLMEEAAKFASYYFKDDGPSLTNKQRRNVVYDDVDDGDENRLSIFKHPGRPVGGSSKRMISDREYNAAKLYML